MIYLFCLIIHFITGSDYDYTFNTVDDDTKEYRKTLEQTYTYSLKDSDKSCCKRVQIWAAFDILSSQNASLYALKKYICKKKTDYQAHYQFFSYLLHHLREKKWAGLCIEPNTIKDPEKYLLGTTQPNHAINYHFDEFESFVFSIHLHDHLQHILPTAPDSVYLLDLKMNSDRYVIDIIDTTKNNYVIGMALFDFPEKDTVNVSRFYIASDYRQRNLGKMALECLTRFAKIKKACSVELFIQPFGYKKASGHDLIKWYKSHGFKIINEKTLLAKKILSDPINFDKARLEVLFH